MPNIPAAGGDSTPDTHRSRPASGADSGPRRTALVLPGGGARSAYQVGVLKALAEAHPPGTPLPYRILTGTSAGGILTALLAAHARDFRAGVDALERFWRHFHVDLVFRADVPAMLGAGLRLLGTLVTAGTLVTPPRSLLDTTPLRMTLERHVNFARLRHALEVGDLEAIAVSASSYTTARSITFYDSIRDIAPWERAWRRGVRAELSLDHLMASAAVPFVFPAVQVDGEWYGDGAMRQVAPLSAAVRLGADRLLVIGLRDAPDGQGRDASAPRPAPPSFGHLLGYMLDTLFMDGTYADLERLQRLNDLVARDPVDTAAAGLRHVDAQFVSPSMSLSGLTGAHLHELPRPLRMLLRTMGAGNGAGTRLLSFLLFEPGYTGALIDLGLADGRAAIARGEIG